MAIRANQLTNFKGEAYATTKQVETKINELSSSVAAEIKEVSDSVNQIKTEVTDGLIDKGTGNLNAKYNPIKVLSTDNKTGLPAVEIKEGDKVVNPAYYPDNDYSKIQFIGDCKVTYRNDGQIVIRIGENLNSSTFNTQDGQTDGTASFTDNSDTYPTSKMVNGFTSAKSVWLKGTSDTITITTAGKIHFDDAKGTKFTVKVTANGSTTPVEYICGPVVGNGTYGTAPCVLTVTDWATEKKTDDGATGYEANISITITLSSIVTKAGDVSFDITSTGTEGAKSFGKNVAYFIVDTTTMPQVSNFTAKLTEESTKEYAGITYISSGTVTYAGTVANLNVPATDASNGASIQFNNTGNYAADVAKAAQTIYDGQVSNTGALTVTTTPTKYSTVFTNGVEFIAWNINGSASAKASLTDNKGNSISKMIVCSGTPDSSLLGTGNRRTLDGANAYTDANAPEANDLMIYGTALQYPQEFIDNTYYQNSGYTKPSSSTEDDGSKAAVFKFSASGTENSCTLTITGTNLTDSQVKSVTFGNSMNNLKPLSGYTDNGSSSSKTSLVYKFAYKTDADKATTDTGVYLKVVFTGTNPTITKITKGL